MEHEIEYGEDEYRGWLDSSVTRHFIRLNKKRLKDLQARLEAAANGSTDPQVTYAYAQVQAARTVIAELEGSDRHVGGQQ